MRALNYGLDRPLRGHGYSRVKPNVECVTVFRIDPLLTEEVGWLNALPRFDTFALYEFSNFSRSSTVRGCNSSYFLMYEEGHRYTPLALT